MSFSGKDPKAFGRRRGKKSPGGARGPNVNKAVSKSGAEEDATDVSEPASWHSDDATSTSSVITTSTSSMITQRELVSPEPTPLSKSRLAPATSEISVTEDASAATSSTALDLERDHSGETDTRQHAEESETTSAMGRARGGGSQDDEAASEPQGTAPLASSSSAASNAGDPDRTDPAAATPRSQGSRSPGGKDSSSDDFLALNMSQPLSGRNPAEEEDAGGASASTDRLLPILELAEDGSVEESSVSITSRSERVSALGTEESDLEYMRDSKQEVLDPRESTGDILASTSLEKSPVAEEEVEDTKEGETGEKGDETESLYEKEGLETGEDKVNSDGNDSGRKELEDGAANEEVEEAVDEEAEENDDDDDDDAEQDEAEVEHDGADEGEKVEEMDVSTKDSESKIVGNESDPAEDEGEDEADDDEEVQDLNGDDKEKVKDVDADVDEAEEDADENVDEDADEDADEDVSVDENENDESDEEIVEDEKEKVRKESIRDENEENEENEENSKEDEEENEDKDEKNQESMEEGYSSEGSTGSYKVPNQESSESEPEPELESPEKVTRRARQEMEEQLSSASSMDNLPMAMAHAPSFVELVLDVSRQPKSSTPHEESPRSGGRSRQSLPFTDSGVPSSLAFSTVDTLTSSASPMEDLSSAAKKLTNLTEDKVNVAEEEEGEEEEGEDLGIPPIPSVLVWDGYPVMVYRGDDSRVHVVDYDRKARRWRPHALSMVAPYAATEPTTVSLSADGRILGVVYIGLDGCIHLAELRHDEAGELECVHRNVSASTAGAPAPCGELRVLCTPTALWILYRSSVDQSMHSLERKLSGGKFAHRPMTAPPRPRMVVRSSEIAATATPPRTKGQPLQDTRSIPLRQAFSQPRVSSTAEPVEVPAAATPKKATVAAKKLGGISSSSPSVDTAQSARGPAPKREAAVTPVSSGAMTARRGKEKLTAANAALVIQKAWRRHEAVRFRRKYYVYSEIYDTERNYVEVLRVLAEVFWQPLQKLAGMPASAEEVFADVDLLLRMHEGLLADVEARIQDFGRLQRLGLADVLLDKMDILFLYDHYINNFPEAMGKLSVLMKSVPEFAEFVRSAERRPECMLQDLPSLLIQPVQRIPRYKMLLADLARHVHPNSAEGRGVALAIDKITSIALFLNERKRSFENEAYLAKIQESLTGKKEFTDVASKKHRQFLKDGPMKLRQKKASAASKDVFLFLFNDIVLVCAPKMLERRKSALKRNAPEAATKTQYEVLDREVLVRGVHVSIVEEEPKLWCLSCAKKKYWLEASSPVVARQWVEAVTNAYAKVKDKAKARQLQQTLRTSFLLAKHSTDIAHARTLALAAVTPAAPTPPQELLESVKNSNKGGSNAAALMAASGSGARSDRTSRVIAANAMQLKLDASLSAVPQQDLASPTPLRSPRAKVLKDLKDLNAKDLKDMKEDTAKKSPRKSISNS